MTTPANWRLWGKLATSGPASLTRGRWRTGRTFWIDTVNGSDAYAGTSKEKPKKTWLSVWLQGILAGDKIVLMPNCNIVDATGNTYTFSVPGVEVVGQGLGTEMAQISRSAGSSTFLSVAAPGIVFDNVKLPAGTALSERIAVGTDGSSLLLKDCIMELGAADLGPALTQVGATQVRADGTIFRVTSRGPITAIGLNGTGAMELNDCTIDGGVFGWVDKGATPYAQIAAEIVSGTFRARNTRLLNHSDIYVHAETNACVVDIEDTDADGESLFGEDCSVVYGVQPICSTAFTFVSAAYNSGNGKLDVTFSGSGAILHTAVVTLLSLGVTVAGTWSSSLDSGRHAAWHFTPTTPFSSGDYSVTWEADDGLCSQQNDVALFTVHVLPS